MNKKFTRSMLVLMGLGLSSIAYGNISDAIKVCVYDPEAVMSQSKELAGLAADIDKKYQQQFDVIKKEEEKIRDDATKFQAKASVMNEIARETEQEALVRRKRDSDAKAERVLEDYKRERQKVSMRFLKQLEQGVSDFALAEKYDLVIPKGPGVFALARADQTSAIVAHVNKKFDATKKTVASASVANAPLTVAKK